jgi:proline iminopeptidase
MPRSETPLRSDLFPEISPYASGMLAVDGRHTIYWEQSGNPEGVPVVFLHGGPGAGSAPVHRRFFDPQFYRIVVFDQRGCGRSMPLGELQDNTTGHLVADMEKLRTHLGIPGWLLFGGSWGSTLALAYGLTHPERATGFILRGIFLGARPEIDWFLHGMRTIFPEAWREFAEHLPVDERSDLLGNYYRRLIDRNPDLHRPAARAWSRYEAACSTLYPTVRAPFETDHGGFALALSRIEAHYFANGTFVPEGWPWGRSRPHPPPARHHRAGSLRHRLPARDRRCAGPRLARGALCRRARCRPQCAGARHPRRARQRHRELPPVDQRHRTLRPTVSLGRLSRRP